MRHALLARRPKAHALIGLSVAVATSLGAPALAAAPDSTDLDRVVVTAAGFEQIIREAPASISVITREDLERRPVHSLAEALADIEGVDVGIGVDKTGAPQISLRGMPSEYTLVLIDGRRQNTSGNVAPNGFGSTANSFIPPVSAIERIEVIRGPMSTLYGSDAMGGVINIITRSVGTSWSGAATLETTLQEHDEFGDTRGATAYLHGPLVRDLLGLTVRGGITERDEAQIVYRDANGDPVEPWMGANPVSYDGHNGTVRLSLTPGDHHDLWFEAARYRQTYDNREGQMGTLGSGGYADTLRFDRDQATLAWDAEFERMALQSSLQQTETDTSGRLLPAGTTNAGAPRRLENRNRVFDTRAVTDLGAHRLSVGGQYIDARLIEGVAPTPFESQQWAVFAEDEWRITERVLLTLGARHDDHSAFGSHLSPRAYLVWNASERWVVKGGHSVGYRTPNVEDLSPGIKGFGGQGTIPLIGSPALRPETSGSTELGVYFTNGPASASVTAFHNEFEDKIAAGTPVANCAFGLTRAAYDAADFTNAGCVDVGYFPRSATLGQSVNIDSAVTQGVEVAGRLELSAAWSVWTNYTFTDSEQTSGLAQGQPLTNTPRHLLNAGAEWQATDQLGVYVRGEYRSERYRGPGEQQEQLGDFKPYSQFHVGGHYEFSERVSLNAAVQNVFDKDFVDYLPYLSSGQLAYANTRSTSEAGRRLWLSVRVAF